MRRRTLLLIPMFALSIYACDDHTEEEEAVPAGYEDVAISGTATDEALAAFAAALEQGAPQMSGAHTAVIDTPAADAVLSKATPTAFSWHFGTTAMKMNTHSNELSAWPSLSPGAHKSASAFLSPLRELLGAPRAAHAHGTPFTGTATFLVFSTAANPTLLRAFTSETSFTPDSAAWTKLGAAGSAITLTLTSADFENNRVVQGGGPFAGGAIQFTIGP